MTNKISFAAPDQIHNKLDKIQEETGLNVSELCRISLIEKIDDLEGFEQNGRTA